MSYSSISSFFILLSLFLYSYAANSQNDTLKLFNGNDIIGEIKSMDKGVLIIETAYSKKDFQIEWRGIKEIYADAYYLLVLSDGTHINGSFRSVSNDRLLIKGEEGGKIELPKKDLVYIKEIDKGFWSRLYARVDFGYKLARANNLEQYTIDSRFGYIEDQWSMDAYFNTLISSQDSVEDIRRSDAGLGHKYHLIKGWYSTLDVTFLTNTEQALDLRTNGKAGLGRYFFKTNRAYWGASIGVGANIENFAEDSEGISDDRYSWEGFFGTELNLYDIGDFNLFVNAVAYPSITEQNRWRFDLRLDLKYDLPLDFYIRIGSTVNYDNQPAVQGNETDYIFTNGIGWKW